MRRDEIFDGSSVRVRATRAAALAFLAIVLFLCARAAAAQDPGGRWTLRIQDTDRNPRIEATIRLLDARANSCMSGVWKQVALESVTRRDDAFFDLSGPIAYSVRDGSLTVGRARICDAYQFVTGSLDPKTITGDFGFVSISYYKAQGSFSLTRAPDRADDAATAAAATDRYDIILIPTDDFPYGGAVGIANQLGIQTHLKVRAVLNLGSSAWQPFPHQPDEFPQYDATVLKEIAAPAIAELKRSYGGDLYILLTTHDINFDDRKLRFLFSANYYADNVSIVSLARMVPRTAGLPEPEPSRLLGERLYKMVLRTVGVMYLHLPRTSDPSDLMFSPLMSVDALDFLEPRLPPAPGAAADKTPPHR